MRYVDVNSANPTPPYTNWTTAAATIQDAVDAAVAGDEIVVTNGTYASGGRPVGTNVLVNRVAVDKPLTVRSVNGAGFTFIEGRQVPGITNGDGAIRCVYLTNKASLSGSTLTNGATRVVPADDCLARCGGGVWCESVEASISKLRAPWYVVPADHKWFTRIVVAAAIIETLASLKLEYPAVTTSKLKELAAAKAALCSRR